MLELERYSVPSAGKKRSEFPERRKALHRWRLPSRLSFVRQILDVHLSLAG
jgi:hypothetical protein